jgi:phosphoketolase
MKSAPKSAPRLPRDWPARVDAWWRAANCLSVGQISLYDNPLLERPLRAERGEDMPEIRGWRWQAPKARRK